MNRTIYLEVSLRTLIFISLFLTLSTTASEAHIARIYKQWHLLPKTNTSDIEKSKSLKQYKNQLFIYKSIDSLIKDGKVNAVISEGCEGEINESFHSIYNSWNYKKLDKEKNKDSYADILSLVPLKLEVKYKEKLLTVCGDNLKLIEENSLASSDLNGFVGYYTRLIQFKGKDDKKFELYRKSLLKDKNELVLDPIKYARDRAKESLKDFENYVLKRNEYFLSAIKKNIDKSPAVIIGGVHLPDLIEKLRAGNIKFKVMPVEGYPENSDKLFDQIKLLLK